MYNKEIFIKFLYIDFLNISDEETKLLHCFDDPWIIEFIKNPSEKVQLEAVKKN